MVLLGICVVAIQLLLYGAGIATGILIKTPPDERTTLQPATAPRIDAAASTPAPSAAQPSPAEPFKSPGPAHLTVQVASFHEKDRALKLAALLKREGFGNVTVGEYRDRTDDWHFVSLGPYHEWEEASRVAADLDRSWDVHAWVRPVNAAED
jgi:cell division septation protein DedD